VASWSERPAYRGWRGGSRRSMKRIVGVAVVCLLTLAGCGGASEEDPSLPSLDGPATFETVEACLRDSERVEETVQVKQHSPRRAGQPLDLPPQIGISFKKSQEFSHAKNALVHFLSSESEADVWIIEYTSWLGQSLTSRSNLVKASVPFIVLQYSQKIDADDLAVLKACTTEPD